MALAASLRPVEQEAPSGPIGPTLNAFKGGAMIGTRMWIAVTREQELEGAS